MINKNQIGDIVLANYYTFKQEVKTGMFLIYAIDSAYEGMLPTYSALKISTEPKSFQLKLESSYYRFLHYDSYVNANSSQKICHDQIISKLGSINSYTMQLVKKQIKHYMHSVYDELDKYIEANHQATISCSTNPTNDSISKDSVITIDGHEITLNDLTKLINLSTGK